MSTAGALRFRVGRSGDEAVLWAMRTRCVRELCSSHYPADVIARWSASPPPAHYAALLGQGGCVVAEDAQGRVVGYGMLVLQDNEVDALFVDPDAAGQGVGRALLQQLFVLAAPDADIVLSASLNAVAFYQRGGFIAEGPQDYLHPSGITLAAIRMRRPAASAGS